MPATKPSLLPITELTTGRASYTDWDLDKIKAAGTIADGTGNLCLAVDLCTELMADPKVSGALDTRISALQGLDITFEASAQGRRRKAAVRALEAGEDFLDMFEEAQLKEVGKWTTVLGLCLTQSIWEPKGDRMIARQKVWSARNLRWDIQRGTWVLRCIRGGSPTEIDVVPGDGVWTLFTQQGEGPAPWRSGIWRGIAPWWLLKRFANSDWGKYSATKGAGVFVGLSVGDTPTKKEDREALARDIVDMGPEAAIVLSKGLDLKLLESTANTSGTFVEQTRVADEQMTYAILGSNMTAETGGSFAKSAVLDGVRLQILASDAEILSTTIHDSVLRYWAEFNFGDANLAPFPRWETEPPADVKSKGDSFLAIANGLSALLALDDRVDVESLLEEANIPMLAKPKELPPAPTPPVEPPPAPAKALPRAKAAKLPPHVRGQLYADQVADEGRDVAREALQPSLRELTSLIENAEDYEGLRQGILDLYRGASPDAIAETVERALILSDLMGRLSASKKKF